TGHLHLEGSVPTDFLARIALKNDLQQHANLFQAYRPRRFGSFAEFSKLIILTAETLRTRKDFLHAAQLLGERLRHENVIYAEIIWVPQLYFRHAIPLDDILSAMNTARRHVLAEHGIEMNWIIDLVRGYPDKGSRVLKWLETIDLASSHIVGIGLGGNETYSLEGMRDLLLAGRALGLDLYPHSGEQCGPDEVEAVIEMLSPRRIAHGIRAAERDATLHLIQSEGIHLDICPTSNLALGVFDSFRDLPIRALTEAGCSFSINTDDPALLGIDLDSEIRRCMDVHGLTADFLHRMYQGAADATFLPSERRADLRKRLA
ncbi:MAG: hypothetical protein ABF308_09875, partial [Phaeobacter gallaeciensis]